MESILSLIVIVLTGLGMLLSLVGSIWFYVEAFRQDALWGLACLFIPFAAIVFFFKYTERVLMPVVLSILGIVCVVLSSYMLESI